MGEVVDLVRRGESQGLRYEVIWFSFASGDGHHNGYVEIPEGHPLFGLGYHDPAPGVSPDDLTGEPAGKRGIVSLVAWSLRPEVVPLEILFDVHGSLTYAGPRHKHGSWWLGFDCGHAGDDPHIQDAEYAERECLSLIEQIAKRYPVMEKE